MTAESGFDPKRRLCPDGACVGVVGPQGRCTVCGRPADTEAGDDASAAAPAPPVASTEGAAASPSGGFDPGRRLCDDGSCVGVVGADGLCGACGRKAD